MAFQRHWDRPWLLANGLCITCIQGEQSPAGPGLLGLSGSPGVEGRALGDKAAEGGAAAPEPALLPPRQPCSPA